MFINDHETSSIYGASTLYSATSPVECHQLCRDHVKCEFWTFGGNECFLKDVNAEEGLDPQSGYTSGPKICEFNYILESCDSLNSLFIKVITYFLLNKKRRLKLKTFLS